MMPKSKTLVVVAHPDLEHSVVNKRWVAELKKYPERFTVHELYRQYSDWQFDVAAEQRLIEAHPLLVLQFPFYWFSCPPLLKKWLDDVFLSGWGYGPGGDKMRGRKMAVAITVGIHEKEYRHDGGCGYTLQEMLRPFEVTARYIDADYQPFFACYGTEDASATVPQALDRNAEDYIAHLEKLWQAG